MTERRNDWIAIAFLVVLISLIFSDVLFLGRGFYQRDLTVYHFPMKSVVREALLEGRIPQWNPYLSAGQPLAANPAFEVFYPPQLLVLLPDYVYGYSLHILFHIYLAAIGMYLFLRSLGLRSLSAIGGAIAFALGGPLLSLVRLLPFLFSVAWLPLIFLFARRFFQTRRPRDFAAAALFFGLQALVAEPTTFAQTAGLIAAYALYRWWVDDRRRAVLVRAVLMTAALVAAALLIAAVQILPGADFARDTVRSKPFDYSLVSFWSMAPARPLELLFPRYFRDLRTSDGAAKLTTMYNFGDPFIGDFYFGLLPVIGAFVLLAARARRSWFVAALIAISFIVAIGDKTPLLRALYSIGIFDSIRYPEKFALSGLFVLMVWSALSLDALFNRDVRIMRMVLRIAAGATLFAIVAALLSSGTKPADPVAMIDMNVIGSVSVSPRVYWLWIAARAAAVVAVVWALGRYRESIVPVAAAILLIVVDISYLRNQLAPTQPHSFFEPPAIAAQADRSGRLFHGADWEWADNSARADQFMGDGVLNPWMIRNGLFPRTPAAWGVPIALEEDFDQTHLLATSALLQSVKDVKSRGQFLWIDLFMPMAGVTRRAEFRSYEEARSSAAGDSRQMQPVAITAAGANPRFFFAEQMVQIGSREEFVDKLVRSSWSPRAVFVEKAPFQPVVGEVSVRRDEAERIELETRASGRGFLFISISPHRYWTARVDGVKRELVTANVGFQGLIVDGGTHHVELVYANPLIKPALAISVLAILAALAAIIIDRRSAATVS